MSFFRPNIPLKQKKEESHHPWERRIKETYSNSYKYCHNSANNPPIYKKTELHKDRIKLTVVGNKISKEFIYCYYMVKGLHKYKNNHFEAPSIRGVTSAEWPKVWNDLKIQYGGKAHCIQSEVVVLINDKVLGGEKELKKFIESRYVYHLCIDYYNEAIQQLASYINCSGRPCAYMHFSINGKEIGNMIFMLYADLVPRTCENFLRLCEMTKGGYSGSPVHRIVKDCWIQCGGFSLKNSPDLKCENFIIPHDRRGVLCMTNDGRDVECSTQFFVLLQPAPWMEHKYVAFGQLIVGEKTLSKIESVPTWYESPIQEIIIYKAGVFNMECEYIPVNKNANEYLNKHIEDLIELGELLFEELLTRVFIQIELSEPEHPGEEGSDEINRSARKKDRNYDSDTTSSTETYVNNDYDVEVYDYEDDHYSATPSAVVKPTKPYYIPLTDVPYPGEINSTYDLKKLLRGNYCYETDLEHDIKKRKEMFNVDRRISIPDELVGALFECFVFDDHVYDENSSDSSIRSFDAKDAENIDKYITDNLEKVSIAGPIVKEIANIFEKYEVFYESNQKEAFARLLSDDELRIIRMGRKAHKSSRAEDPSCPDLTKISLSTSKVEFVGLEDPCDANFQKGEIAARRKELSIHLSPSCDNVSRRSAASRRSDRRSTALRRSTAGLRSFIKIRDESKIALDTDKSIKGEDQETKSGRKVRITAIERPSMTSKMTADARSTRSSFTPRTTENGPKDGDGPTLKDFKPAPANTLRKSFTYLKKLTTISDDKNDMLRKQSGTDRDSFDDMLDMQHGGGVKFHRLSTDYVMAIGRLEQKAEQTMTTVAFSRRRPSLSVSQYKIQNKVHYDLLSALDHLDMATMNTRRGIRRGLRLPGDSPIYENSWQEKNQW